MSCIFPYDREARNQAFIQRWLTPGRASDYIRYARDEIKPGDKLVLRCRVSNHVQQRNQNLADQEANLRKRARQLGAIVVAVDHHIGPGWDASSIFDAAVMARRFGAKIFAESTDRLIRNPLYSKDRQNLRARDADLRELQLWTDGIVLVTNLHPDARPAKVRSHQCKRGQQIKGRKGGRPTKMRRWKARRMARIKLAKQLRQHGLSYRSIAIQLNDRKDGFTDVTGMTVYNWVNRRKSFAA